MGDMMSLPKWGENSDLSAEEYVQSIVAKHKNRLAYDNIQQLTKFERFQVALKSFIYTPWPAIG